jgi:hypothetical protein
MNTITKLLQARRTLARYVRTGEYSTGCGLCHLLYHTQDMPSIGVMPDNFHVYMNYVSDCAKTWPVRLGDPEGRTLAYPIRRGTDTVPHYANPERLDLAKHIIKCIDEDIAKRRAKRDLHVTLKQIKAGKYDLCSGICCALGAALDCKPYYDLVMGLRDDCFAAWLAEPNIQHPKEATLAYPVAGVDAFLHETDDEARTNPRRLALLDYMIEKTKP